MLGILAPVTRAKRILQVVGICLVVIGGMALPFPQTNPEALTQSLFVWVTMTGTFVRPGLVLVVLGLACLALAALLPSGE
jgi:protein-S-isoprenylcysteine O-methyltransferase Ste14